MRTTTLEQKLNRVPKKLRDFYRYDFIPFDVKTSDRVDIICPIHGSFNVKFHEHIYNESGCPQCGVIRRRNSIDEFLEKAKRIHSDKYDYSLVAQNYKDYTSRIKIVCAQHGIFEQIAYSHADYGNGCPECSFSKNRKPVEQFIEEAKRIHGDKYDYSLIEYKNSRTNMNIICNNHGSFLQSPSNHIHRKAGCPLCAEHTRYCHNYFEIAGNKKITGFFYILEMSNDVERFIKIGITKHKNIFKRYEQAHGKNLPYEIKLLHSFRMKLYQAFFLEQQLLGEHKLDQYKPINPFAGQTECLKYSNNLINKIKQVVEKKDILG